MASEQAQPTAGAPGKGRVFLVVDDDPMVRKIVARGLGQLDAAEILEEEDGLAAQEILRTRHVDVVVTDVVMPKLDGLALMKWAQEHCPGPLWIVLSGLDTFDAAVEALQLGAFDYLAKPPEIPRVRVAVRNALDQIELVRERKQLYAELEASNVQLAEKVKQLQTVCRVLEEQAATIRADLNRAEVIQRALLPQQSPNIPGWSLETRYSPGSSVGGDFYDAIVLDDRHLGLVIADAAGHGVAAAMLSVLFKLRLRLVDEEGCILQPSQVLVELNHSLYNMLSAPGAFITASYVLLDLSSGEGQLASAGHPACIIRPLTGEAQRLTRTGPALGLEEYPSYTEHDFTLQTGDRLMLYTDGILEGGPDSPDIHDLAHGMGAITDRGQLLDRLFDDAVRDVGGDRDDITLVLLERGDGVSRAGDDAIARKPRQAEAAPPAAASAPLPPPIAVGDTDNAGFIAIAGDVTWLCAHGLLESARELLAEGKPLTLDLSACEHMDSTCLGTVHEIVTANADGVRLQAVPEALRDMFDELSMRAVLEHIQAEAEPLPANMAAIETASLTPEQQGARILSAHESLASLSEENQEQFRAVVESLRADLPG